MQSTKLKIESLLHQKASDFEIAQLLKADIKSYFENLQQIFLETGGKDFLVRHTRKIDEIIKTAYMVVTREMFGEFLPSKNQIPIALVALGSYGREQLCVHSDIDLMIVYSNSEGYKTKELIEKLLYMLWDCGLKLGHRVHEAGELIEASQSDITIKTAIIESRFIEGSRFVWTHTQNAIARIRKESVSSFITAKLAEQQQLHQKHPLSMEPNLKEGVGGFRDANLVYWLGKILYNAANIKSLPGDIIAEEDYKSFRIALEFLFRVRSALHLTSGKKSDILYLDLIAPIATLLGYESDAKSHTKFIRRVIASLKTMRLFSTIWIERLASGHIDTHAQGRLLPISIKQPRLSTWLRHLNKEAYRAYKPHPTLLAKLLLVPRKEMLDRSDYRVIRAIFEQPHAHSVLYTLSYAGMLGYVIAPLKKVINLPQFDGYHRYGVDKHSLESLWHLEHMDDEELNAIYETLSKEERMLLKLVVFLHDCGKGRKQDHHRVGSVLFGVFAKRLGVKEEHIKQGQQLILYHTLLSNTAQREDIYDSKTILSFASHFGSELMLKMILLLTYADLQGVGSNLYDGYRARLIKTLYHHSISALKTPQSLSEAAKRNKKERSISNLESFKALTKQQQKKLFSIDSNLLFLRYRPERIVAIASRAFSHDGLHFHITNEEYLTIEIIAKESFRLGYLLYQLGGYDVLNMDICKLFDQRRYIKIDFAAKITDQECPLVEKAITTTAQSEAAFNPEVPVIARKAVAIECDYSSEYAQIMLRCANQKGLLSYIIDCFNQENITITNAKIHTIKNRARDMFLVEKKGNFCHNTEKLITRLTKGAK